MRSLTIMYTEIYGSQRLRMAWVGGGGWGGKSSGGSEGVG
jgi:hypothetical protein